MLVSETIWNCREIDEHNVHLKHTFWRIWNDLELQKNNWKHVSKACFIAVFETIWNCRKKMKTWKQGLLRVQYDTFWYDILTFREKVETFETYARQLLGDPIVLSNPPPPSILLQIWTFSFSHFLRWSVGYGDSHYIRTNLKKIRFKQVPFTECWENDVY